MLYNFSEIISVDICVWVYFLSIKHSAKKKTYPAYSKLYLYQITHFKHYKILQTSSISNSLIFQIIMQSSRDVKALPQSRMTFKCRFGAKWPSCNPEIPLIYFSASLRHKVLNLDVKGYKTPNMPASQRVQERKH